MMVVELPGNKYAYNNSSKSLVQKTQRLLIKREHSGHIALVYISDHLLSEDKTAAKPEMNHGV